MMKTSKTISSDQKEENKNEEEEYDEENFSRSLAKCKFSTSFNYLVYYGVWPLFTKDKRKRTLFRFHQLFAVVFGFFLIYGFCCNLYKNFGRIKDMSWNICVNSLFTGSVIKSIFLVGKSNEIYYLRRNLHADMKARTDEEDLAIHRACCTEYRRFMAFFYVTAIGFGTIWQITRYMTKFSDQKEMPLPIDFPFEIDLNVSVNFDLLFFPVATIGALGLFYIIHQELSMYSLLLQLKREYDILLKDLLKLDFVKKADIARQSDETMVMGSFLQKAKTKALLKEISCRQKKAMSYVEVFEGCYSNSMMLQLSVMLLLSVSIGLQCIMFSPDFLGELSYQIGYMLIVLTALFLLCHLGTVLDSRCREVGFLLYSSSWYLIDRKNQEDLLLMILISQRPPRITCMRSIDIDLNAFMGMIKNIYAWLALFRQVALKNE